MPLSIRALSLLALLTTLPAKAHDWQAPGKTLTLNGRALPLGDGRVSAAPRAGHVFACQTRFHGGGAQRNGPWIKADNTWDETAKLHVLGQVLWPQASFQALTQNGQRQISGNGLPLATTTGIFPVAVSDPAYQIDRNPNAIHQQNFVWNLPLEPQAAADPACLPMGPIGVALNGVPIFNALDDEGRDAVAHEVQDSCNGHPERAGRYHYHGPSPCMPGIKENQRLVGYALDGYGIYSLFDDNGRELKNSDLDACHGRVSRVLWNGRLVSVYHYVMTREFPYTLGCFRGSPVRAGATAKAGKADDAGSNHPPPSAMDAPSGRRQPPPEAMQACRARTAGSTCNFTGRRGEALEGSCQQLGEALACVPAGMPRP